MVQNKLAENDYLEINYFDPRTYKFSVSEDLNNILVNLLLKNITDFVSIHNEYIVIKGNE